MECRGAYVIHFPVLADGCAAVCAEMSQIPSYGCSLKATQQINVSTAPRGRGLQPAANHSFNTHTVICPAGTLSDTHYIFLPLLTNTVALMHRVRRRGSFLSPARMDDHCVFPKEACWTVSGNVKNTLPCSCGDTAL